jgi:flagellar hook-basal body complex protein FliE
MDALSALRSMFTPGVGGGAGSVLQNAAASVQTPAISPSDLAKLDSAPSIQPFAPASSSTGSFENYLGNLVGDVSQKQTAANDSVNALLSGQNVSLHQTMISMEEASVSFQMMVEVRNKLLDSYQEIMKMQV